MDNNINNKIPDIFFDDPRLRMTVAGRFLIRIVTWVTYLVFSAAIFTFLISDSVRLRLVGVFLGLILIDILIHRGEGDVPIAELPRTAASAGVKTEQVGLGDIKINAAKVMRPVAFAALERTFDASIIAKRNFFLEATARLIEFPDVEQALGRLDIPLKDFKQKLEELTAGGATVGDAVATATITTTKEQYLKQAEVLAVIGFEQAIASGHNFIEIGDLFAALPGVGDVSVTRLFNLFTVTASDIERSMIFSAGSRSLMGFPAAVSGFMFDSHRQTRHRVMNRAWTSRPTPTLDRYGTDFTDLARDGSIGFLVGHAAEYDRLVETLARPTSPNALLVGDAGIGKEAIVAHLARRLSKDDVPKNLFDRRLVSLEVQSVVAGAAPEELAARLKTIVNEIYLAGNIILYIPDIHNLVHTSGTAFLSAADALLPVIKNDGFPVIGATDAKDFKQLIEPRSDFTGTFEVIHVEEITEADAEKILTYEALVLEKQAHITISFGAIKRAVTVAKKYFHGKFLPSSAVDLLKSTVAHAERSGDKTIGPDLIVAVAETKTNIPIHEASGKEAETLLNLEEIIHKRMIGQEEAVKAVATALREYRSGLSRKGGPIASFLFVGPTGVGKTELAKILADVQFGSEKMMTRFDMTEYQDKASFVRFIGSPDGQTRGALTDAVLEKPYGLILFDEFEKAYPDILNLFLQVLDDGRLTDGLGRTVDFTNTIVIATSNAHSDIINDALAKGESMSQIADYLKSRLVDVFKPELINRFSKIIIFKNLEPKELGQIVALGLAEFAESVKAQGIYLEFDPDAVAQLTKLGYDPAFGARPLRRVIEEQIRAPLAEAILGKKIGKDSRVKLTYKEGKFEFEAMTG